MNMRSWLLLLACTAFLWACEVTVTTTDSDTTTPPPQEDVAAGDVAVDDAGPSELIRSGEDGILVPTDNAAAIAGAVAAQLLRQWPQRIVV